MPNPRGQPAEWPADPEEWPQDVVKDINTSSEVIFKRHLARHYEVPDDA